MHACMKDILIKCVSPPLSNPYSFPISYVLFLKPTKSAQCYQYRCVASSLNTPDSLSSRSHYQLSVALQVGVGPGDPVPHPQAFVWVDLVWAMCMQCSFHEFLCATGMS